MLVIIYLANMCFCAKKKNIFFFISKGACIILFNERKKKQLFMKTSWAKINDNYQNRNSSTCFIFEVYNGFSFWILWHCRSVCLWHISYLNFVNKKIESNCFFFGFLFIQFNFYFIFWCIYSCLMIGLALHAYYIFICTLQLIIHIYIYMY